MTQIKRLALQKVYAVTGVDHGSIVHAKSATSAKKTFRKHYDGEKILSIKDISDYNLENL